MNTGITPTKRAALYVRVSTADRGQTVENQLQPLQEVAGRLGWTIVAIHRDEGISGAKGRQGRPSLDAMLQGVTRREYDVVAACSVCRLGQSLPDLLGVLGELQPELGAQARSSQTVRPNPGWRAHRRGGGGTTMTPRWAGAA